MDGVLTTWGHELALGAAMTVGLALATLPFGLAFGLAAALAKELQVRLGASLRRNLHHRFPRIA